MDTCLPTTPTTVLWARQLVHIGCKAIEQVYWLDVYLGHGNGYGHFACGSGGNQEVLQYRVKAENRTLGQHGASGCRHILLVRNIWEIRGYWPSAVIGLYSHFHCRESRPGFSCNGAHAAEHSSGYFYLCGKKNSAPMVGRNAMIRKKKEGN